MLFFLLSGCLPVDSPGANSQACAQEQIDALTGGWQITWSVKLEDGYIAEPPFVVGDRVILIERSSNTSPLARLRAFQIQTGEELWFSDQIKVGYGAAQDHDNSYFATYAASTTSVIDLDTGELVLDENLSFMSALFSLTIDNDILYWHDYYGNFRATRLPTGELVWERSLPEAGRGSSLFVTADKRLIVSLMTGLWVLDAETGNVIERFSPNDTADTRLYVDSFLVGEANYGLLKAVSIETGETVWEKRYRPFIHYEPPILYGGKLYFIGEKVGDMAYFRSYVLAVALEDGRLQWRSEAKDGIELLSGIDVLKGVGYAIFEDGTLRSIDLETGEINIVLRSEALSYWRNNDSSYFPVPGLSASDELLFASFGCSTLYALRPPP